MLGIDTLRQAHLAQEGTVLDLHLLVDAPAGLRARPLARHDEHLPVDEDVDAGWVAVVFQVRRSSDHALVARLQRAVARAAPVVPSGKPTKLIVAGPHVVYGDIVSTLSIAKAKGYTEALLRVLGRPAGVERTYL